MIIQNVPELSQSCVVGANECAVPSICGRGECTYHDALSYHCYCAGTGMAGDNCNICKLKPFSINFYSSLKFLKIKEKLFNFRIKNFIFLIIHSFFF